MKDEEIDQILKESSATALKPSPELLQRIAQSIRPTTRPVRPLGPPWLQSAALALVCAATSIFGALRLGLFGFAKMNLLQRALIFLALAALLWLFARALVAEMTPASRRRLSSATLLLLGCMAMAVLYALLFRDYSIVQFVPIGINCLLDGMMHAIPATFLCWLVVRRGCALNPVAAGLAAGALGGIAGIGMLELHCPNFETAHRLVWHLAVAPLSALLGASVGWLVAWLARLSPARS